MSEINKTDDDNDLAVAFTERFHELLLIAGGIFAFFLSELIEG